MASYHHRSLLVVLVATTAGAPGCANRTPPAPGAATVAREVTEGPVQIKIAATPAELPFDQRVELVIEVTADSSITIETHDYAALVRHAGHQFEFRAMPRERREAVPVAGDRRRWSYRYDLDFFVPGDFELPGARVSYSAGNVGPAGDAATTQPDQASAVRELSTEPLPIKALGTAVSQVAGEDLKKIRTMPPVELREPWRIWWVATLLTAIAMLAALFLMRGLRRTRSKTTLPVPAHEWARRQIATLVAEDLIGKGRVQEFYYRLSDILRGYIERRFGVHAREMTTEEFLAAVARDTRFPTDGAVELNRFLIACDMVKYARFEPDVGQADALLRTAGEFVERTRERPEEPAASRPTAVTAEQAA